jgi:cytidyltransferase-like protein
MSSKKRVGLYIGRFQPLHNGHMDIIKKGLEECDIFIVIIGSINKNDDKNPFTFIERECFVQNAVRDFKLDKKKLQIYGLKDSDELDPLEGVIRSELWYYHLRNIINNAILQINRNLYLYGSIKDSCTADYLEMTKRILDVVEYVSVPVYTDNGENINSTDIRNGYAQSISVPTDFFKQFALIAPHSTVIQLKLDYINKLKAELLYS